MDRHQVSIGLFFLRVLGGGLVILGRSPAWSEMLHSSRVLSDPLGSGGEAGWMLTIFSEFLCTVFVILGIFTRFTAIPPLVVMLVTALVMPVGTVWSTRETFLLYALPFFVLTFTGPGEYSVDGRVAAWANPR
jgi:putative oxidoreductase